MSVQQVFRQVTEHNTEIQLHEDADNPLGYVEAVFTDLDGWQDQWFLSLTPAEARTLADALLSSSQRVSDRIPHGNT